MSDLFGKRSLARPSQRPLIIDQHQQRNADERRCSAAENQRSRGDVKKCAERGVCCRGEASWQSAG